MKPDNIPPFFDRAPWVLEGTCHQSLEWGSDAVNIMNPNRQVWRYRRLIARHAKRIRHARVLDMACYDGRWSAAAAFHGAKSVRAVEWNYNFHAKARENLSGFPVVETEWAEIVPWLMDCQKQFDFILCCGLLYHTTEHARILREARRLLADDGTLVVDTAINTLKGSLVNIRKPEPGRKGPMAHLGQITGAPSLTALENLLTYSGFEWEQVMNDDILDDDPGLFDYRNGRRVTMVAHPA